jgi:uncharacterized surface protein with fasciclin (FAS1) repeats
MSEVTAAQRKEKRQKKLTFQETALKKGDLRLVYFEQEPHLWIAKIIDFTLGAKPLLGSVASGRPPEDTVFPSMQLLSQISTQVITSEDADSSVGSTFEMLSGNKFTIRERQLCLGNSEAVVAKILRTADCCNGVVHYVDKLLPVPVSPVSPDLEKLGEVLQKEAQGRSIHMNIKSTKSASRFTDMEWKSMLNILVSTTTLTVFATENGGFTHLGAARRQQLLPAEVKVAWMYPQMPCTHPWATKWTLHEEEKDWIQDLQVGAKVRVTGGKKLWTADIVKYQKYHQFVIKDLVNDDASSGEESE